MHLPILEMSRAWGKMPCLSQRKWWVPPLCRVMTPVAVEDRWPSLRAGIWGWSPRSKSKTKKGFVSFSTYLLWNLNYEFTRNPLLWSNLLSLHWLLRKLPWRLFRFITLDQLLLHQDRPLKLVRPKPQWLLQQLKSKSKSIRLAPYNIRR